MKILGIDIDTKNLTCSLFDGDELKGYFIFSSKEKTWGKRFDEIIPAFEQFLKQLKEDNQIDYIIAEEPLFIQNALSSISLSVFLGACRTVARQLNIPFRSVHNMTWKKEIIGNGRASKDEIYQKIVQIYPQLEDCKSQHIVDSTGIALFLVKKVKEDAKMFEL